MDFWNDEITEKSWERLIELRNRFNFILIGGWAVYLYTARNKSKDIDIIVDYDTLWSMKNTYGALKKNDHLKKYEINLEEGIDVYIYVPKYSELVIPVKDIFNLTIEREGFILPKEEALAILKIDAFIDRHNSTKGKKDAIDITNLVFFSDFDFNFFKELTIKYDLPDYPRILLTIIEKFDLSYIEYLALNENEFAKLRKKYIEEIRKIL